MWSVLASSRGVVYARKDVDLRIRSEALLLNLSVAARKTNLMTIRARKNKRTTRMFANAQKDHSILLARIKNNVKGNQRKQLVLRVTCVAYGKVVLASSTS